MKKVLFFGLALLAMISISKAQNICGSEFAKYGLEGKTYEEAIDYVGVVHNEYQEYIYLSIVKEIHAIDAKSLQALLKSKTQEFFTKKGIDASSLPVKNFDYMNPPAISSTNFQFSKEAQSILTELDAIVKNKFQTNSATFLTEIATLKARALSLKTPNEQLLVGMPVSVAMHSYNYWTKNLVNWEATGNDASKKQPCLGAIGLADVSGAINGAIDGVVLGVGGSLAGGILGSAASSTMSAFGCALSNLFNWW